MQILLLDLPNYEKVSYWKEESFELAKTTFFDMNAKKVVLNSPSFHLVTKDAYSFFNELQHVQEVLLIHLVLLILENEIFMTLDQG
jgi:hypothetical protein